MTRTRSFAQLAGEIALLPGPVRLVGVDGLAGAGKTTFASRLSDAAGNAPVVHTDDFATHDDALGWWPRLLNDVIEPLTQQRAATFRPYDWVRRAPGDEVTIEPASIVVIEGVAATHHAWRDRLALRLWVDAPHEVRRQRGLARDGEQLRDFWSWWMKEEDRYVADEQPQLHVDLVVDGDPARPPAAGEFVVLSAPRAAAAPLDRQ